jgi:hypothetical protein
LEDTGLEGRIILKRIHRKWDGSMDWINLTQNRGGWWAVVNMVMNLRVPSNAGIFLTSRQLCSMELVS